MNIVIIGLSITSTWGNGHATTYRSLVRELSRRGHRVLFLEHDKPWYAANRDMPSPPFCRTELYASVDDLRHRFADEIARTDLTIVGSYVPEGVAVGQWVLSATGGSGASGGPGGSGGSGGVTAFYDIDTPVTLARLERGDCEYLSRDLIRRYPLYLSFTGGPTLQRLERQYGAPRARALYCSVDPELYFPDPSNSRDERFDLGYLGTYSPDRQPSLERFLLAVARRWSDGRFAVAGPLYPPQIEWPANVQRIDHLPAAEHRAFYNAQRFTLNLTRADMLRAGYSPSVRLFEAAACGVPIISDAWAGIDSFFRVGSEILVARSASQMLRLLREIREPQRRKMAQAARQRVLSAHTAAHRAAELEGYAMELLNAAPTRRLRTQA